MQLIKKDQDSEICLKQRQANNLRGLTITLSLTFFFAYLISELVTNEHFKWNITSISIGVFLLTVYFSIIYITTFRFFKAGDINIKAVGKLMMINNSPYGDIKDVKLVIRRVSSRFGTFSYNVFLQNATKRVRVGHHLTQDEIDEVKNQFSAIFGIHIEEYESFWG